MSRPLVARLEHKIDADQFHKDVFAAHGRKCYFHGKKKAYRFKYSRAPEERCTKDATDAMHVVPRSSLGPKSRFACAKENGRPGCRNCHDLEERGVLEFPKDEYNAAVRALNKFSPKLGLRER